MNGESLFQQAGQAATRLPAVSLGFFCRLCLAGLFVILGYQFKWGWLRFLTSEAVLRISASVGMTAARISFDTIRLQGELFHFVVSCTFVDVFVGSIPLLWDLKKSLFRNLTWTMAAALVLFAFNVMRLEIGQILYARGVPWTFAHEFLAGVAYFGVWLVIWRQRASGFVPSFPVKIKEGKAG